MRLKVLSHPSSLEMGTRNLLDYCKKNNIDLNSDEVLYFPIDRKILVSRDEIDAYDIMNKLTDGLSLRESIERAFDVSDPFKWEDWTLGADINCGYEQILNFLFVVSFKKRDTIVIDRIEKNLHVTTALYLIKILIDDLKIKNVIITTYQDTIIEWYNDMVKGEEKLGR